MTAPPVVFTAGGVMISGLSLTIRDKRPTPREQIGRVLLFPLFVLPNRIAAAEKMTCGFQLRKRGRAAVKNHDDDV